VLYDLYEALKATPEYQTGAMAFEEVTAPPKSSEASIFGSPIFWIGIAVAGVLFYVSRRKQPVMIKGRK
jgi:hypothetical protein